MHWNRNWAACYWVVDWDCKLSLLGSVRLDEMLELAARLTGLAEFAGAGTAGCIELVEFCWGWNSKVCWAGRVSWDGKVCWAGDAGDSAAGTCPKEKVLHRNWLKRAANSAILDSGGWINVYMVDYWVTNGTVGRIGAVTSCVDAACVEVGDDVVLRTQLLGKSNHRVGEA